MISQKMNNSRISNHAVTIMQVSGDDKFYKTIENNYMKYFLKIIQLNYGELGQRK